MTDLNRTANEVRDIAAALASSPNVQEYAGSLCISRNAGAIWPLTESKEALVATVYASFDLQMKGLIRTALNESGITRKGAADMLLAAALGALRTGDIAENPYRARLAALVETLVLGLKARRKVTA
jgi:hypothetical protein